MLRPASARQAPSAPNAVSATFALNAGEWFRRVRRATICCCSEGSFAFDGSGVITYAAADYPRPPLTALRGATSYTRWPHVGSSSHRIFCVGKLSGKLVATGRAPSPCQQFLASAAYARGQSLIDAFAPSAQRTLLRMITPFGDRLRARQLNAEGRGDQAAFIMQRA